MLPKVADTGKEGRLRVADLTLCLLLPSCPFPPKNGKGWNSQHMLVQQLLFCDKEICSKIFNPTSLLCLCVQVTVEDKRDINAYTERYHFGHCHSLTLKIWCKKKALRISFICENVDSQEWFFLYSHGNSWYFPIICFNGNTHSHFKRKSK